METKRNLISVGTCLYPASNKLAEPISVVLDALSQNPATASSIYLDTTQLQSQDRFANTGEDHHQGLARTHRLSDGSVYLFLTQSNVPPNPPYGQIMQFKYSGPLDGDHFRKTHPLTVAPQKQLLFLNRETHPSDIVFLPDVNNQDSGYLFVTEEYNQHRLMIYLWNPGDNLVELGFIQQDASQGPAFVFLDRIGDTYYLGIAENTSVRVFTAAQDQLFPTCNKGCLNHLAFKPLATRFPIAWPVPNGTASQVKLVQDSLGQWYLLAFRSDPNDDPNGTDYVDLYAILFEPFYFSALISSTHVTFPSGDTGFASTGTHYVEPSGRILLSSSYRWSKNEGPGNSSYVSRVDEIASAML